MGILMQSTLHQNTQHKKLRKMGTFTNDKMDRSPILFQKILGKGQDGLNQPLSKAGTYLGRCVPGLEGKGEDEYDPKDGYDGIYELRCEKFP